MNNQQLGKMGEDMAARYLKQKGYLLLERNYRTKSGEIDLIGVENDIVHFVEVKTRQGDRYGRPAESVTDEKMQHIRRAAGEYLSKLKKVPRNNMDSQFDVIEIQIDHIENV